MELQIEIVLIVALVVFIHLLIIYFLTRKVRDIRGKHCCVTGGSSGIGLWVAINCAKLGANITIVARNQKWLEKAKILIEEHRLHDTQKVAIKAIDLSKSFDTVEKAFTEIEAENGPIYMLVNCAGVAICGRTEDVAVEDVRMMMDVNYFASFYPTRYVLPRMKAARDGIIVFTASQAALIGVYGYSAYAASKFALRGLAEAIAMEVKQDGISVTLALPSDTDTPGFERENKTKPIETALISGTGGLAHPKEVGEQIVKDALRGSFFSIRGFESWLLSLLCVGMAPWNGPFLCLLQFYTLGLLRLVGLVFQWNFQRIIRKCAKEREKHE